MKWFPEKSKSKSTKKFIRERRMWGILTFFVPSQFPIFGLFKIFWDIIWLGNCLNRFVTLRKWWNDFRKNTNPKILKNSQGYEECEESSHSSYPPILHFIGVFNIFWDIIWFGCCLNRFVTLRRQSNDFRKNRNPKILKNWTGYEECEESSHSSYPPNSQLHWS